LEKKTTARLIESWKTQRLGTKAEMKERKKKRKEIEALWGKNSWGGKPKNQRVNSPAKKKSCG